MIMATIVGVNLNKGRAVALSELGDFVLLEIFTDEPEMYDEIKGNFDEHPLGSETVKNITRGEMMEFFIQDYCSKERAQQYLSGK